LATCEAIKNNGKRCEAKVQTGSQWCWNHDPAHTAKRKASGSMGGKRGEGEDPYSSCSRPRRT
jgi:hypothetical protein